MTAAAVVGLHLSGRENAPPDWAAAIIRELKDSGKFVVVENPEEAQVQLHVGATGPIPKGAWYFQFGRGGDYFEESQAGEPAADVSLISSEGQVLASARIAVWQGIDWRKTLRDAQAYAPRLLLGDILECPSDPPPQRPGFSQGIRPPSLLARSTLFARRLRTSITKRLRNHGSDLGWYIALRSAPHQDFQTFPTQTLCAADPWLIPDGPRLYLFYEEMDNARANGRLACVEILSHQKNGPVQYGERRVILEAPYHLSYPAVVRDGPDWYLIPESSANRTVDLYVADEFPWRWRRLRTLQQGRKLVDTTPMPREDGGWWFFTGSMIGEAAAEAYLYSARTIEGDWKPHPANPICRDIQRARMAGPMWRDPGANGKLYRPSQDCSIRYGYAITWNEVLHLDDDRYEEREAGRIEPSWTPDGLGTHTICRLDNGWEARDGIVRVPASRLR